MDSREVQGQVGQGRGQGPILRLVAPGEAQTAEQRDNRDAAEPSARSPAERGTRIRSAWIAAHNLGSSRWHVSAGRERGPVARAGRRVGGFLLTLAAAGSLLAIAAVVTIAAAAGLAIFGLGLLAAAVAIFAHRVGLHPSHRVRPGRGRAAHRPSDNPAAGEPMS
jgi:hypothetical protein